MILALLKSTIILLAAACVAGVLRRQSSAIRHRIWVAGLIGALCIPLCTLLLPAWDPAIVKAAGALFQSPHWAGFADAAVKLWIAGTAVGMGVLLAGTARLAWVAIRAERFNDARWLTAAHEVAALLSIRRPVRLLQNRTASLLGTWGIVSPNVLLPSGVETWPDDRVRMVLVHELAHIKRHDWCVQVLAEAARAIYWFNPLFWMAYSRLRRESEHACDDAVVRLGTGGTEYAEELVGLARSLKRTSSPVLAMAQPSHLERRLMALLNPSLKRLAATPWATLVVALAAIAVTLPLAAVRVPSNETSAKSETTAPGLNAAIPLETSTPQLPLPPGEVGPTASGLTGRVSPPRARTDAVPTTLTTGVIDSQPNEPRDSAPPLLQTAGAPEPACAVTASIRETPLVLEKTAPLGPGPWHINADRSIWVWDQPYVAKQPMKTMWIRPAGAELSITARRLDGPAPPFEAKAPCCYQTRYQAADLAFPTGGCWEVTATAGGSTLTFVTKVSEEEQ